jgi:CheY-like chemotaxis protein
MNETCDTLVIWADDQVDFVDAHRHLLDGLIGELELCADGAGALRAISARRPDLLLLDLQMPPGERGGFWVLENLPEERRNIPSLVISGRATAADASDANRLGAYLLVKDRIATELRDRVAKLLEQGRRSGEASDLRRLTSLQRRVSHLVFGILDDLARERGVLDVFRFLVPKDIALKTYERLIDHGSGEQRQFVDILDYRAIIQACWSDSPRMQLLAVSLGKKGSVSKEERTKWLEQLNEARKVLAHPERGPLNAELRRAIDRAEAIVSAWEARM